MLQLINSSLLQLKQLKPLDHNSMMRLSQSSEWQPAVMEKAAILRQFCGNSAATLQQPCGNLVAR
jgi:hypothetical protein